MHAESVGEDGGSAIMDGHPTWLVRSVCGCGVRIGVMAPQELAEQLVDRLLWTDEASHLLERMPPYLQQMIRPEVEDFVRTAGDKLVTFARVHQARQGGRIAWEQDAEQRLARVPAPVRAMARVELERTALERGHATVTVSLMDDVKARYFGLFAKTGAD